MKEALIDEAELLYRQVHPGFVVDGRVTGQAFRPTKKDDDKLSVARSSLTTPQGAYEHFTTTLALASAGSWGVTVGECRAQALPVRPDPLSEPDVPDPAHAYVDFEDVSKSQAEAKAARLARIATARGRLFPDVAPSA